MWEEIRTLLGLGQDELGAVEMALRVVIVYAVAIALVRLDSARLLGKASAFDFIVAIMFGSMMSRAIIGASPLFPTLIAGAVLILSHWFFGWLSYHTDWVGPIIKGRDIPLIRNGTVLEDEMQQAKITHDDLMAALHLQGFSADPSQIRSAYMERNGRISVIPYEREPKVTTVSVEPEVKTIRIEH